jgi:predicted transcriptional regulator
MTEKYRDEPAEIRAEPLTASECGLRTRVIDLAALLIVTDVESLEKIAAFLATEAAGSQVFGVAEEIVRSAIDVREW